MQLFDSKLHASTFNEVKELEQTIAELSSKLKQKDQMYMKFKDLKLDYKQLLDQFEQSEIERREQKEQIANNAKVIHNLKKLIRQKKRQAQ